MKQIIIWGAGNWGEQAYWYYKEKGDILFYVDSAPQKVGMEAFTGGGVVRSVDAIKDYMDAKIVIAVADDEGISEYLKSIGIKDIIQFPRMLNKKNEAIMTKLNEDRSINLGEILQNLHGIKLQCVFSPWGSGVLDYAFLRAIVMKYHLKKYLEIGTYIGESLKAISDLCQKCYSITVPNDSTYSMTRTCKKANFPDYSGRLADDMNVQHFYCDSKKFEWSQVPQDIDLYFIDGDHSYRGVFFDTRNVFTHKKADSIVIWHDFKNANLGVAHSEVAVAVKDAIGEAFDNVYCVDNNMCGIYLPPKYQSDLILRSQRYTESQQDMYVYEVSLRCLKNVC